MTSTGTQSTAANAGCVLCVDLDGTLIATDMFWESALLLCRKSPLTALAIPLWVLKGRAHLKEQLAQRVTPNPASLPYRAEVIEFIKEQRQHGRRVILATASHQRVAQSVADHLGIFDHVIASDATSNRKGREKLKVIQEHVGTGGFEYIGDSSADLPLWEASRGAYLVGPGRALLAAVQTRCTPRRVFETGAGSMRAWISALRPQQWIKNLLLFLPLILAHKVSDHDRLVHTLLAFVAFCLCASAIYVLNDLLDLEADRNHPRKRYRPFAGGALSVPQGLMTIGLLLPVSLIVASFAGGTFIVFLAAYLVLAAGYSLYLKGRLLLDVLLLSYLYTHRIISGAVAAHVDLTQWLGVFSMFFFLSLAFAKRYSELTVLQKSKQRQASGRSYSVDDLEVILSVGPASGYLSVLVFCLYINSDIARGLYPHHQILWMICPILLYWITRIWFFAKREALVDDPVLFAVKDRVSWIAGLLSVLLVVLAAR